MTYKKYKSSFNATLGVPLRVCDAKSANLWASRQWAGICTVL